MAALGATDNVNYIKCDLSTRDRSLFLRGTIYGNTMPILRKPMQERFAQSLAGGKTVAEAYGTAGYSTANSGWLKNAYRLKLHPNVKQRVTEILANRQMIDQRATERAIERLAVSKEAVAREFAVVGFANMADYVRDDGRGNRVLDLTNCTREQMAAVQELTVEYHPPSKIPKKTGEAGEAEVRPQLEVKKVRLKLHPKIAGLRNLAQLFGWLVEPMPADRTTQTLEERLRSMTDEQHVELARELAAKARALLIEDKRNRERAQAEAEAAADAADDDDDRRAAS
jgi:phage terminase small subunit